MGEIPNRKWWLSVDGGKPGGPYTLLELSRYCEDGKITLDAKVCLVGDKEWKRLGDLVAELNAQIEEEEAAAPPPPLPDEPAEEDSVDESEALAPQARLSRRTRGESPAKSYRASAFFILLLTAGWLAIFVPGIPLAAHKSKDVFEFAFTNLPGVFLTQNPMPPKTIALLSLWGAATLLSVVLATTAGSYQQKTGVAPKGRGALKFLAFVNLLIPIIYTFVIVVGIAFLAVMVKKRKCGHCGANWYLNMHATTAGVYECSQCGWTQRG